MNYQSECPADKGHLNEHYFELIHHFLPDFVYVGELCAFAQHRFGKIEALAHGGFHCVAMSAVRFTRFGVRQRSWP